MSLSASFGRQVIPIHLIVSLMLMPLCLVAGRVDSLRNAIAHERHEADRLHAMCLLAVELMPDSMARAESLLTKSAALPETGTTKQIANYYNYWGLFYWYAGSRQEAIAYFRKTLTLPEHPSTLQDRAMAANNMGSLYRVLGKTDSAQVYFQKALEIDIRRNHKVGIAKTQYDLAILHFRGNQYHIALQYILDAVRYHEETADTTGLIYSYNVLANIYSTFDSLALAGYYYQKGLKLADHKKQYKQKISYFNNIISLLADEPDSLKQTLTYFQQGVFLASQHDDHRNLLAMHGNMGRAYSTASEYEMASSFFRMGLKHFEQTDDMSLKARFLYHYGNHLFNNRNVDMADDYLHQSLEYAKRSGDFSTQSKAYKLLASVDSINGDYIGAMKKFHRSVAIRDSLFTIEKSARIAEVQLLHDAHKYEARLADIETKSRYNRLRYIYSFITGITGVLMLGIGVVYYRQRKKVAEKNLIIKEIEHSKLQIQLNAKRQELTGKALSLINAERLVKKLQEDMKSYIDQADDDCRHKLQSITRMLNTEDKSKELWRDFENRFNELSDGFISKLTTKHSSLSPSEIRMCAMLRLQMSSKQISELTQRSLRTVEQSRFKIRKKIGLNSGDNLVAYLLTL